MSHILLILGSISLHIGLLLFSLQPAVCIARSLTWEKLESEIFNLENLQASKASIQKNDVINALVNDYNAISSNFFDKVNPKVLKECGNELAKVAIAHGLHVFCYYVRNLFKDEDLSSWDYFKFRDNPIALLCFDSETFYILNTQSFYEADIFFKKNMTEVIGTRTMNAVEHPGQIVDYFDDLLPKDPSTDLIQSEVNLAIIKIMADYWKRIGINDVKQMERIRPYYQLDPFLIILIPDRIVMNGLFYTNEVIMMNTLGRLLLEKVISVSASFNRAKDIGTSTIRFVGQLAIGWDPDVLYGINPGVLKENIHLLRKYQFDKIQTEKLALALVESYGDYFGLDEMVQMGYIAQGLSAETLRKMNNLHIHAPSLDGLALSEVPMKVLVNKVIQNNPKELLKLKRLAAIASSSTLSKLLTDSFVYDNIEEVKRVRWTFEQAIVLCEKYKRAMQRPLTTKDLVGLGTLLKGVSKVELMGLMKNETDVMNLCYRLPEEDSTSTQIQGIVMTFRKATRLSEIIKVSLNPEQAFKLSRHLAHLYPQYLKNLKLTPVSADILIKRLSTMSIVKLPIQQIKYLSKYLQTFILKDVHIAPEDQDAAILSRLGVMALGLTSEEIMKLSPATVVKSLDTLGQLPLSAAQSQAVMTMLYKAEPKWKCKLHIVGRTGTMLQFDSDVFKINCHETIARAATRFIEQVIQRDAILDARRKAGFVRESELDNSDKGMEGFVTKIFDALARATPVEDDITSSRIQIKTLSCTYLKMLKSAVSHVAPGYFTYMPQSELARCIPYLGQVKRWTADHVEALLNLILEYTGIDFKRWNETLIQDMGSLLSGLSASQLSELRIYEVESLNRIASGPKLSYDKGTILVQNWLYRVKDGNIGRLKIEEFSSLSQLLCVFNPQEIMNMPDTLILDGLKSINRQTCSHEVAQAYLNKLSKIMGDINVYNWPRNIIIEASSLISFVNPDQILNLKPQQLAELPPGVIYDMPPDIFQKLSVMQLTFLNPVQSDVINEVQYNGLDKPKQLALHFYAAYARCSMTTPSHISSIGIMVFFSLAIC
ncbi:uncharacterized protein LOC106077688 [Biomphalaria glabrata]|uniref:Uncharacterized protein LOC106077688 n=1 Tax=Biomphalaria glabrata TaxID=6526 RepID=A0A9W3AI98_BIOGL|nr:uncharacterized protein LOC106077688 [Biomphalaria glabrata]